MRILAAATEPWAYALAKTHNWPAVVTPDELDAHVRHFPVDLVLVLHWHWIIPAAVLAEAPTWIGFHASALPAFRGGDPIGNQQARGITATLLTAFRLTERLDAGPILMQRPLSLVGTRADVLLHIRDGVEAMLPDLLAGRYTERAQAGEGSFYRRADAHVEPV